MATAADIANTNFSDDYNASLAGNETIIGKNCYKLDLTAKNDQIAYAALTYWVEEGSFKPVKTDYYGAAGKLLKTAYFRDFKTATGTGNVKVHEIFMVDPLQEGRVTRMMYTNLQLAEWPDYFFTKDRFADAEVAFEKATPKQTATVPTAQKIMEHADNYRGEVSWGFELKVVDFQKKSESEVEVLSENTFRVAARKFGQAPDSINKALAEFTAPKSDMGKKLLMDGPVFWMSFPDTKNLVRITPAQRLAGMATAADIANTNFKDDYDARLIGTETVMGKNCYKLDLTAKNDQIAYAALTYWVEVETFKPLKADYYGTAGKLLKTAYFRDFKEAAGTGNIKVHEIFMIDPLQEGRVTRMIYTNLQLAEWQDYFFTKDRFADADVTFSK
jgi:hypothetical protein